MNPYDRTQLIDDYLENNMSPEKKNEFEGLLSDHSASLGGSINLNDEVKMQKAIIQEIQRRALRQSLKEENRKYRDEERKRKETWKKIGKITLISSPFATAAVAAVMVVMFVISPMATILKESSNVYLSEIQKNYSSQILIDNQSRGAEDFIANARYYIAKDEWGKAKKELHSAYKEYFNEGVSHLQGPSRKSSYYDYLWLQVLCEIQTGHVYKAERILRELENSNSANYKEKARKILDTLNEVKHAK